ncbi:MAG: Fic family protein [Thermodesulfobacteriota bacterium]
MGEVASKCDHVAGVPLDPEVARYINQVYLAKGALATTAIEGNTLTEEEAKAYLEGKLDLPSSREYLGKELDNIVAAFNKIIAQIAQGGPKPLTIQQLKDMNKQVLNGLELEESVVPGQIRRHPVVVGRYRCAPYEDCEFLLEKFINFINGFPAPPEMLPVYSILKAIIAHLYFVWIHPFADGNGRTARLIELYILLSSGFPQPTGHLLSNHYNLTRQEYYRRLDQARNPNKGVVAFIEYAVRGFLEGLVDQLKLIKNQQWTVAWTNYVHEQFKGKNSSADTRRRVLALALSEQEKAVGRNAIRTLTPDLAQLYAGKTTKTTTRDLNVLLEMGLVKKENHKFMSRREKILAFMPWRHNSG